MRGAFGQGDAGSDLLAGSGSGSGGRRCHDRGPLRQGMELEGTVIIGTLLREAGRIPAPRGPLQTRVRLTTRRPGGASGRRAANAPTMSLFTTCMKEQLMSTVTTE